jgi:hypothetical protein
MKLVRRRSLPYGWWRPETAMRRWLLVFPPWLKSMTEPPVPDYEAQAREADAIADKAAPGSRIEGGYRILAEGYRSLARVAAHLLKRQTERRSQD